MFYKFQSPEANMSDYQSVYHKFRELVQSLDEENLMGNLQRWDWQCAFISAKRCRFFPQYQCFTQYQCL